METTGGVRIEILDSVWCRVDKKSTPLIKNCLSYTEEFWKQGPYHKERREYKKSFLVNNKDGKTSQFLTGFLPLVAEEMKSKNIKLELVGKEIVLEAKFPPHLEKIAFRKDQLDIIKQAVTKQRGVLQGPTGIGKTALGLGIISCFPHSNTLFLCHEKTLMNQTYEEMVDKGFSPREISKMGGGFHEEFKKITIGMAQTFRTIDPIMYSGYFDAVIIDECHLFMEPGGTYDKILSFMAAPVRLGLTATLPNQKSHRLLLTGLLGPVIGKLTIQEGVDLGLLAKPKIKIIKVPFSHKIRELSGYGKVYEKGIVRNLARNLLLVNTTKALLKEGKTALVLVTKVVHGQILAQTFKRQGIEVPFVYGKTEEEERREMLKAIKQKNIKCIIASSVWRHGINIPSLGAVINAAGEKSEVSTLQRIGRGLRKTDEKDEVIIVDFFDESHPYLVAHFGHRISLYCEEGWI